MPWPYASFVPRREDAFETLNRFFQEHNCDWEKGLNTHEPMKLHVDPEAIVGRSHQISVALFPELASEAFCPNMLDKNLYEHYRSIERIEGSQIPR